jgi:hypothetical protein
MQETIESLIEKFVYFLLITIGTSTWLLSIYETLAHAIAK